MNIKVLIILATIFFSITATAYGNPKIDKCLKTKNCLFFVFGSMTVDPKMSFLVMDKLWKTFDEKDKADLRAILKQKINEANSDPDKYIDIPKNAPLYNVIKPNIKNMRSYSIVLSHGKTSKGDLKIDEEIMVNY